jgi:GntR family transcriptional regulator
MEANFVLSQTDGRPMYLQIMTLIKAKVAIGEWPSGFKLPSIRELAVSLNVSVITVKRAYQELEMESVINTQQGKGSFVSEGSQVSNQIKEQEMEQHLLAALSIAQTLGLNVSELSEKFKKMAEEHLSAQQGENDD